MTINVGTFETALQAKFNAANSTTAATDFVYLAKASDQLEFTLNQATANFESLPAAANRYFNETVYGQLCDRFSSVATRAMEER